MIYFDKSKINNLPLSCQECELRSKNNWVCSLVEWNHTVPLNTQKYDIDEKEYYDNYWKHPDCPLRETSNGKYGNEENSNYADAILDVDSLIEKVENILEKSEWYNKIYLSNELNSILTKYEGMLAREEGE